MNKKVLLGVWRYLLPIPPHIWTRQVGGDFHLDFLSAEHQRVRNFVVLELPKRAQPLAPGWIASKLQMREERVVQILDDLERHKTFLFRNPNGEVTWAYPVTADQTPHHMTFSTGEQVNAA